MSIVRLDIMGSYPRTCSYFTDDNNTTSKSPSSTTPFVTQTEYSQSPTSPSTGQSGRSSRGKKQRRRQKQSRCCSTDYKGAYKTELCRCVVEGTVCRFGAQRCKWAHSLEELIQHRNTANDDVITETSAELASDTILPFSFDNLHVPRRRSYSLPEPANIRCLLPSSIWVELLTCDHHHPPHHHVSSFE